jgi:hypothetical protein
VLSIVAAVPCGSGSKPSHTIMVRFDERTNAFMALTEEEGIREAPMNSEQSSVNAFSAKSSH